MNKQSANTRRLAAMQAKHRAEGDEPRIKTWKGRKQPRGWCLFIVCTLIIGQDISSNIESTFKQLEWAHTMETPITPQKTKGWYAWGKEECSDNECNFEKQNKNCNRQFFDRQTRILHCNNDFCYKNISIGSCALKKIEHATQPAVVVM